MIIQLLFFLNALIVHDSLGQAKPQTTLLSVVNSNKASSTTAPTVFCATRSANSDATDTIDFDSTTINDGLAFNLDTDTFTVPAEGLYWLHFSVGSRNHVEAGVVRLGCTGSCAQNLTPNIWKEGSQYDVYSVTSRSVLNFLQSSDQLTISSSIPLASNSMLKAISFSGFHVDGIMSTVAAFSVGRTTSVQSAGSIEFDRVHVDTHQGWKTNTYTIPVGGTWVITMQSAQSTEDMDGGYAHLHITGFPLPPLISHENNPLYDTPTAPETVSHTVLASLAAGDTIVAAAIDAPMYSDDSEQVALMAFLYSPVHQPAVAWAGWRSVLNSADSNGEILTWNVLVDEGNAFGTDRFTAPVDGVYYVSVTCLPGQGSFATLYVILNGVTQFGLTSAGGTVLRTYSRAAILTLVAGDVLQVNQYGYIYGENNSITASFVGFRIHG